MTLRFRCCDRSSYGVPKYKELILDNLIDLKLDGSFRLDLSYFDYCTGLTMTNDHFSALFGEPVRTREVRQNYFQSSVYAFSVGYSWIDRMRNLQRALNSRTVDHEGLNKSFCSLRKNRL